MILTCKNIIKVLPIIRFELYKEETCFLIQTNLINTVFKERGRNKRSNFELGFFDSNEA